MPCATDPDEILRALDTSETPLTDGRDEAAPPRELRPPVDWRFRCASFFFFHSSSCRRRSAAASDFLRAAGGAIDIARCPINDNGPSESFRSASRSRVEIPRAMRRAAGDAVAEVTRCRSGVRRAASFGDDACATPRDTDASDERRRLQNGRLFFPPDEIFTSWDPKNSHFVSLCRA